MIWTASQPDPTYASVTETDASAPSYPEPLKRGKDAKGDS